LKAVADEVAYRAAILQKNLPIATVGCKAKPLNYHDCIHAILALRSRRYAKTVVSQLTLTDPLKRILQWICDHDAYFLSMKLLHDEHPWMIDQLSLQTFKNHNGPPVPWVSQYAVRILTLSHFDILALQSLS
jgi:hypothetical protein